MQLHYGIEHSKETGSPYLADYTALKLRRQSFHNYLYENLISYIRGILCCPYDTAPLYIGRLCCFMQQKVTVLKCYKHRLKEINYDVSI
jgi:hypothetical protein